MLCPAGTAPRRLLDLADAAAYLGITPWTLREWLHAGLVPIVRITLPHAGRGRPFRKVLVDIAGLDQLITRSKTQAGTDDLAICAPPRNPGEGENQ